MKTMKKTQGVVLVNVCDEYMLVATREARDKVPYLQHINEATAFYWEMLEDDMDPNQLVRIACERYNMPLEKAIMAIKKFIFMMKERGYITIVDVEVNEQ